MTRSQLKQPLLSGQHEASGKLCAESILEAKAPAHEIEQLTATLEEQKNLIAAQEVQLAEQRETIERLNEQVEELKGRVSSSKLLTLSTATRTRAERTASPLAASPRLRLDRTNSPGSGASSQYIDVSADI